MGLLNLYIGEDVLVQLADVRRSSDQALVSDATITAQLRDEDEDAVGSPVAIVATAVEGQYQGYLPSTLPLTLGAFYFLDVTITGSLNGFRRESCRAVYHGSDL